MKYKVTKSDGSPVEPKARYFVLRLDNQKSKDHLAVVCALEKYAELTEVASPEHYNAVRYLLDTVPHISLVNVEREQ